MNRHGDRKLGSLLGVLGSIGWPFVVGTALTCLFYVLALNGPLRSAFTLRYFAAHPVLIVETGLFFVGLAALLEKLWDVVFQAGSVGRIDLDASSEGDQVLEPAGQLLDRLESLPKRLRESHLGKRLQGALTYVDRSGSGQGLGEELKYLSDLDAARQQDSYGLVHIVIWATPMLGFLGTVVGITQALGDLDPQLLATDPKTAMESLLSGLFVAFDTTALALCLSMILMFVKFMSERLDSHVLNAVDQRVAEKLLGRFAESNAAADPQLVAVQRMSSAVLKTAEQLVREQTDHWKKTMQEASAQFQSLIAASGQTIQSALTQSLDVSLKNLAGSLTGAEREMDERLRTRWEQWQTVLSDNARLLHSQQGELVRQGEVMSQVLQATGDVVKLEQALNDNLRALAGAKNFEDTVMSLSAAIHLLNTRVGVTSVGRRSVELDKSVKQGRAA